LLSADYHIQEVGQRNTLKRATFHVNGVQITKPDKKISDKDIVSTKVPDDYVSRAGLKLASVAKKLGLNFEKKIILDVGSSTGGFTELSLRRGARLVVAVDVGTDQLHPKLLGHPKIELHEKTDIRNFVPKQKIEMVLIDVSFISVRYILPHIANIVPVGCEIVVMLKPQFEAGKSQINKGIIKNSTIRRSIIRDFELWLVNNNFITINKADSGVSGAKGNVERFYLIKTSSNKI
jgi:23S rRNA (cytidine1920-2'-O)/16S rRNA (cytidine1409-2'-O)-methyltransferase